MKPIWGKKPAQLSADAGYCSDTNLAAMEQREIDAYIAPGGPSTQRKDKAAARGIAACAKNQGRRPRLSMAPRFS